MATAERAGEPPRDSAADEFQAHHDELPARIRRSWEDALTLPLSGADRAAVKRLLPLSGCQVRPRFGDAGLCEHLGRLRALRAPQVEGDPA